MFGSSFHWDLVSCRDQSFNTQWKSDDWPQRYAGFYNLKVQAKPLFLKQIYWSCFLLYSPSMYFWSINVILDWHISWLFLFFFRYTLIQTKQFAIQKALMKIKVFNKIKFFMLKFIHTWDDLISYHFNYCCKF